MTSLFSRHVEYMRSLRGQFNIVVDRNNKILQTELLDLYNYVRIDGKTTKSAKKLNIMQSPYICEYA